MNALRCQQLTKSFGGVNALVDFSVEFPSVGIVAIIGPNGAGKTTLLNVLTGFLSPDEGRCALGSQETTQLKAHQIARLGLARTFQDLRLIRQVPALDNILLASPRQRGENLIWALLRIGVAADERRNRERAMTLLRFVGLEEQAGSMAGDLSYGEQKLLTLAVCLATDASVLLLDEPVAGVHPHMIEHILRVLRQLRDQRKLIVFVEHDIAAVREVADQVIVMDEGRIIAQGPPGDVLERPEIVEAYVS